MTACGTSEMNRLTTPASTVASHEEGLWDVDLLDELARSSGSRPSTTEVACAKKFHSYQRG
jgi:hypothetical protein